MASAKKRKRPAVAAAKQVENQQQQTVASYISFFYLASILVIAVAILYGNSLKFPLVFDDAGVLFDANLKKLSSSFFSLDLRWVSYGSFGWTYQLFGTDWFWHRLGNAALHAFTGFLLFLFFSRLLVAVVQPQNTVTQPRWPAFFAALAFLLHPVAVYGVAYLVQRSIIMATLFGVASLLCYMEGLNRDRTRWFVWSALFYFLAVYSKEHSIMIPGVAAALTLLLNKPSFTLIKKVWLPFLLYLIIGILIVLQTKGLLGRAYEIRAVEMLAQMSEQQQNIQIENAYPLSIITQGYLFFKYLLLWMVPYTGWMSIDIRQPFATHMLSWPELPGFILFLAYPLLTMKLLLKGGRQGLLGLGLLYPWILFLTELSTVRIQEPFVLYRSYLWMSGLPIVLLSFLGTTPRKYAPVLLSVFCLMLAALAWNRLDTFSDPIKIWSDAIEKNRDEKLPDTRRAYNNRGNAYEALGRYSEALADYQKMIELTPEFPDGYKNSAHMYFKLNNLEEALRRYNIAIELNPEYVSAYLNRGDILAKMGRYAEAFNDFDRAVQLSPEISPENRLAYSNRGAANFNLGKFQDALNDYDKVLSFNAKDSQAMFYRGAALFELNRKKETRESLQRSCDAGNQEACTFLTQIAPAQ